MRSSTNIENLVAEEVIVMEPQPAKTNHDRVFTTVFLFQCLRHIRNLAAIHGGRLWAHYYPRVAFGEEGVIMPRSALTFIISALLVFAEIKSQGQTGFPFQTHPHANMFSVTSLLMYGLASGAELVVSAAGLDPTSVYAIIARLGRIGSLCFLVASLGSLFYF